MFFIQPHYSIIFYHFNFLFYYYCLYTISFICFSPVIYYVVYSTDVLGFFISSFASLYSFNSLFIETNYLWLIYELIKAFEIKISITFNLIFAINTILSCFFFFFLIIDLYFLIPAVITQFFNSPAILVISKGMPTKEANAKIETLPVKAEVKVYIQHNLKSCASFYTLYSLNHVLFLLKDNFLLHLFF